MSSAPPDVTGASSEDAHDAIRSREKIDRTRTRSAVYSLCLARVDRLPLGGETRLSPALFFAEAGLDRGRRDVAYRHLGAGVAGETRAAHLDGEPTRRLGRHDDVLERRRSAAGDDVAFLD